MPIANKFINPVSFTVINAAGANSMRKAYSDREMESLREAHTQYVADGLVSEMETFDPVCTERRKWDEDELLIPTVEIATNPAIKCSEIKARRYYIVDRAQRILEFLNGLFLRFRNCLYYQQ